SPAESAAPSWLGECPRAPPPLPQGSVPSDQPPGPLGDAKSHRSVFSQSSRTSRPSNHARANNKKRAPWVRSHLNEQPALIVIVIAIPIPITMFLDDHHFVVIAVPVPATIMVPIPVLVASLNDECSLLSLRRCSNRQYKAESRQRGECQYELAHIFSSKIPMTINDVFYQSFGCTIVPMTMRSCEKQTLIDDSIRRGVAHSPQLIDSPSVLTILPHFSTSALKVLSACACDPSIGSKPIEVSFCRSAGSFITCSIVSLSLAVISGLVPAGANTPTQDEASKG